MNIQELSPIFVHFSIGFFIPTMSRFLMKSYPCSMHSYVGDMLKYCLRPKKGIKSVKHKSHINQFNLLKKRYLIGSILWGALYACLCFTLSFLVKKYVSESYPLGLMFIFIFLLAFAANIDARFNIIPDIITFPMLMAGILIALKTQKLGLPTILNISPLISIYSAIGIYILCSCIALIFYFKNPFSFGGGDVKLLSAISAFSGFEELAKIIVFSALIFTAYCRVKKLKYAPLAPFIAMSFAAWIFYRIAGAIS